MATVVRARISSEDEKQSTVEIPAGATFALVCMEPATLMESLEQAQDSVQWRLSVEVKIELAPAKHSEAETYSVSLATITLPPVHHQRQAVAVWYWPIGVASAGRAAGILFRWESDRARASADVLVMATESASGPQSGWCGLFALPFPGATDVLRGVPARLR